MKGALAAGLAASFGLRPRRARAAAPMRAIFVYVPDGCIPARWHPSGSETSFTLPEMSAPLERIKGDLLFVKGLEMVGSLATHEGGVRKLLTGTPDATPGISLDVLLGDRLKDALPFSSVQLGVGANFQNGSGSMSFVAGGQAVAPDDNPLNVFSRLFAGYTASGMPDPAAELALRKKKSVLDAAMGDLKSIEGRLGAADKQRLETHLASIREVEARLTAPRAACTTSGFNPSGFKISPTDYYPKTYEKEEHFLTVGNLQSDLAVLALGCELTRVVSIMWSHPVSPTRIPGTGQSIGNHDASHYGEPSSTAAQAFTVYKRWFMERFAYLIDQLRATPAAGGANLLDSTVVFLGTELGDSNLHDHRNMPFVLAGGRAAGLRLGRAIDHSGQPHTRLLAAIANLCGVSGAALSPARFAGATPLDGLT